MAILIKLQPKTFIDSVIAAIAESANKKGVALTVKLADNLPDVFCSDKTKLTQILVILTEQAVRRTEKGTVIIDLSIQNGSNHITFCVEDMGCGVDMDSIAQILDAEIPVGSWPQELSISDYALSLRMASKLVNVLGGKLAVECDKAASTTRFSFTIAVRLGGAAGVLLQYSPNAMPPASHSAPIPDTTEIAGISAQLKQLHDAESGKAMVSFLDGDSDYQKAIETFLGNLPARIEEIKDAYEKGDAKVLDLKIHALKCLAGFTGFPIFTEKAKMMEQSIKAAQLDKLQAQVEELVQLCIRQSFSMKLGE